MAWPEKMRGKGTREYQTIRCCGASYQRWRFKGEKFPGTHHERCFKCGNLLSWPSNYRPIDRKKQDVILQKERRSRWSLQGLTSRGKPRALKIKPVTLTERRAQMSRRYYARRDELAAKGLTSRGTPRVYHPLNRVEISYREFRASLNIQRPEVLPDLERDSI